MSKTKIEELDTWVRIYNVFKRKGYNYIEDILNLSEEELLKLFSGSQRTLWQLQEDIKNYQNKCV
jgi:DNA-directed RNA polymerase alpha subunit